MSIVQNLEMVEFGSRTQLIPTLMFPNRWLVCLNEEDLRHRRCRPCAADNDLLWRCYIQ